MVAGKLTLDNLDILNPDMYVEHGYPWEAWDILRREEPVYWYDRPGIAPFWAITKYEDILQMSKDPKTFPQGRMILNTGQAGPTTGSDDQPTPEQREEMRRQREEQRQQSSDPHGGGGGGGGGAGFQRMLLTMNPPDHGVYRNLVVRNFTPRALRQLEPHIDELAVTYVDEAAKVLVDKVARQGSFDFVTDLAAKLPLAVICEMMGVPRDDWDQIFDWTNRAIGSADPEYQSDDDGGMVTLGLFEYFGKLAEERRADRGDDIISSLLEAEIDGEKLEVSEIVSYCFLLIIAGNETTRNATTGGMLTLIEHPEQRERLRNDISLIPTAVEEMLRWVSPLIHFARTATEDIEFRGQVIKAGQDVGMFYPSANRDEDIFPDPYNFDIGRTPNDHLAFGGFGEHYCLGSNLARTELQSIFRELMTRLPDLELVDGPARLRSPFVGGIKHLPVRVQSS